MENISLLNEDIESVRIKVKKEIEKFKQGEISKEELLRQKAFIYFDVYKDWAFCKQFSFVPIVNNASKREIFKSLTDEECKEILSQLREAACMEDVLFEEVPKDIEMPAIDNNDNWSTIEIAQNELVDIENIDLSKEYSFSLKLKNSKITDECKIKFFYVADSEKPETLTLESVPEDCYIGGDTSLHHKRNYIACDAYRFTGSKAEVYILGKGEIDGYEPFECILTVKKKKVNDQQLICIFIPLKESERWKPYFEWKVNHENEVLKKENQWVESL